jgi:hypothetical protein
VCVCVCVCVCENWGLNLGATPWAPFCEGFFSRCGLSNCLPGLASNGDPPDLHIEQLGLQV